MMDPKKSTDALAASGGDRGDMATDKRSGATSHNLASEKPAAPTYDWLGPSLRRMYDEVLNEPIPESFVDLLQQLYDRQKKR
jgi:hypothetical protein